MSNDTQDDLIQNPAKIFAEWSSKEKTFRYWDKNKGDDGENVPIRGFELIVLAQLNKVGGFYKKEKCGFKSNEVFELEDELNVSTWKGTFTTSGCWSDIKDACKARGGKFAKSVYGVTIRDGNPNQLVNITFVGASFNVWCDLGIKRSTFKQSALCWAGDSNEEHGDTFTFHTPKLYLKDLEAGVLEAVEGYKTILDKYFVDRGIKQNDPMIQADAAKAPLAPAGPGPDEEDEVPF